MQPRMPFTIHLFKLAKINSEIKYVANSIVRETPTSPGYANPTISNIMEWQTNVRQQLDDWASGIPTGEEQDYQIRVTCQIRYHSIRMLLLRPSPAIPKPSPECLKMCYDSACRSIRLYDELYKNNFLVHSWMTFHGLILSTITMIYCIRAVPAIACIAELEALVSDFGASLSILSATGEHWPGAKRCRDILHDLSATTIRWVQEARAASNGPRAEPSGGTQLTQPTIELSNTQLPTASNAAGEIAVDLAQPLSWNSTILGPMDFGPGGAWPIPFEDSFGMTAFTDADEAIRSLFEDLIAQPT